MIFSDMQTCIPISRHCMHLLLSALHLLVADAGWLGWAQWKRMASLEQATPPGWGVWPRGRSAPASPATRSIEMMIAWY